MKNKEQLKAAHDLTKLLSDSEINRRLNPTGKTTSVDYCSDDPKTTSLLNDIEDGFLSVVDREKYNFVLGRKSISYNLHPSNRKRAEALLTVITYSLLS